MARRSLAVVSERRVVAMCAGKDCRKRSEFAKMRVALSTSCDVVDLQCVGVCNGPVVVVEPAAVKPVVYSKLRSKRHRKLAVAAVLGDARARRELADRRVSKKKVLGRVIRQSKRRPVASARAA